MKKTRKKLEEYWDNVVLKVIHPNAHFKKVEEEVKEHFNFMGLTFKRILLPIIFLYIVLGLILNLNIFGSLLLSVIVSLYSNFLPDVDFLVKKTEKSSRESLWYEKYLLLFFAPIIVYYIITGKAKPIYSKKSRCFHNIQSLVIYAIFLIVLGYIFWNENVKIIMFVIFGASGYLFHLLVDEVIVGSKAIKNKIENWKN